MSDYIKREDAQKITAEWLSGYINDDERNVIEHIDIDLGELPPADVRENVRGEWILHIDDLFPEESTMECNQCHEHQPVTIDDNFCPNCGADMRGER